DWPGDRTAGARGRGDAGTRYHAARRAGLPALMPIRSPAGLEPVGERPSVRPTIFANLNPKGFTHAAHHRFCAVRPPDCRLDRDAGRLGHVEECRAGLGRTASDGIAFGLIHWWGMPSLSAPG